jgi:hypothetical protein
MDFKKDKYCVIKKAISKDLAMFLYNYFLMRRQILITMLNARYISPFEKAFGTFGDPQVPNTFSHYGDTAMETLLLKVKPIIEKESGLKLIENYSYARIYKKGDILHRHKDRFSCEISTTMNLGGDPWPIYIEPNPKKGGYKKQKNNFDIYTAKYVSANTKGIEVILKPGDMLIYRGADLEHWRDAFTGQDCAQVFLHYTNSATKGAINNIYDERPHLGLPSWFRK